MTKEPRFPGIDWHCDHCGAYLNDQNGFDDHKYLWKCKECGYKNSISLSNIRFDDSESTKTILLTIGFFSFVGLWTTVMLVIAMLISGNNLTVHLTYFCGLYIISFLIGVMAEFSIRRRRFSHSNLRGVIIRNLREDIIEPFVMIKEMLLGILTLLTRNLPYKRRFKRFFDKKLFIDAILYTIIIVIEVVVCLIICSY